MISLDAHKALDTIEYFYQFMALERFRFGTKFSSLIEIIYIFPSYGKNQQHNTRPFLSGQGCNIHLTLLRTMVSQNSFTLARQNFTANSIKHVGILKILAQYHIDCVQQKTQSHLDV